MRRLATLLLLIAPAMAHAQSPADRAMLAAWDDSLQNLMTVPQIPHYDSLAKAGTGPAKDLRRSLFQARSAELRDNRPDVELALDNLALDSDLHPQWPWPHLALARVLVRLEIERNPLLPSKALNPLEPYLTGALRHIREALKRDPEFRPASHFAIDMMVRYGDRTLRVEEVAVLLPETQRRLPEADALLVLGRYLRTRRMYDSALKVFTHAIFAGGDRSRLELERSRTLMAIGDSSAATAAYWDGLERLTPVGRELYHFDLAWIISADSLAAFDGLPSASVVPWLRRFWNERDAASANSSGDRVLEHLRRWVVVHSQYRLLEPWNRVAYSHIEYGFDAGGLCLGSFPELQTLMVFQPAHADDPRDREFLLDHRGLIYLRHGEPIKRIGSSAFNLAPLKPPISMMVTTAGRIYPPRITEPRTIAMSSGQESWVYWIDGSWRALNFRGSQALGSYAATTLSGFLLFDFNAYLALGQYLPAYAAGASSISDFTNHSGGKAPDMKPRAFWGEYMNNGKGPPPPPQLACNEKDIRTVVKLSRNDGMVAGSTDSDSPPITDPWAAVVHSYALGRGDDKTGKALVTFAIGAKDLVETPSAPGSLLDFPINIRIVAYHAATDRTIQIDTVSHFFSRSHSGWVTGWLELPLPGGEWQLAVYARQDNTTGGVYTLRRGLEVDSAETLTLSDIVTGRADAPPWRAPDGLPFPINPLSVWTDPHTADLYFEVRGLADGTAYTTSIQVMASGAKGKPPIDLRTNDQAAGLMTPVRKHLGLEKLSPGAYQITVTVESGGKKAVRTTTIVIAQP